MDILKQAKEFETMAMDQKPWSEEELAAGMEAAHGDDKIRLPIGASISAINHAVKMATKAAQDLEHNHQQKARMEISLAIETLQDVLERLGK
jgi:hypothetical protein